MHYKIAQLILTPGQKASTTSEIFVAQPDSSKEELVGKLFVLIEIESKKVSDLKIINFLTENLYNNYYQNEKMILRERVRTVKVEHIFESALAKTNKNLSDFLRTEKIKLNPKSINATLGVVYENNLHFANIGKNKAFLIYKNTKPESKNYNNYNSTEIIKNSESSEKKPQVNMSKIFSNVISGSIPKNGYFVFTNEALPEYLSNKQMVEVITALPPASAAEQIKNSLSKVNYYVSFLSLIIKNTTGEKKEYIKEKAIKSTADESVSDLKDVEEKTEKFLTPGGIINFKKWLGFFKLFTLKINFNKKNNNVDASKIKDKIFYKKKNSWQFINKIFLHFKNFIAYIIHILIYIYKTLTNKDKLISTIKRTKNIPSYINNKIKKIINWFKALNNKNKILLIIAIVALLILIQNLITAKIKNNEIKEEEAYTNLVEPIEQKQNQVEASLLYDNEDRAREILSEIKTLLENFPQETIEQTEQYNSFKTKLDIQMEKIRHVIKIGEPQELANFSNLNSNASPENIILSENNNIFSGDSKQKTIFNLDLSDNLITAIAETSEEIKNIKFPVHSKTEDLYFFNNTSIIQVNTKSKEVEIIPLALTSDPKNIVSASSYNNRLYLLDKNEGQIFRFNKRNSGFTDRISWLSRNNDLSNAVSISIDGHVYILKSNGEVLKFLKGVEEGFELDIIEPALESPNKIFVSPELKYIYILETEKKRLVIFDKTGDFLSQYHFDTLNNLKDFTVDETNKIIYLLNKNSVYKVGGTHFGE